MPKRKLYLYSACGKIYDPDEIIDFGLLLTFPIKKLRRIPGCTLTSLKTERLLCRKNVGKKFNLKVIDPVLVDNCIYLGKIFRCTKNLPIPKYMHESIYKIDAVLSTAAFYVFKMKREFVIVSRYYTEVEPLFKIKKKT